MTDYNEIKDMCYKLFDIFFFGLFLLSLYVMYYLSGSLTVFCVNLIFCFIGFFLSAVSIYIIQYLSKMLGDAIVSFSERSEKGGDLYGNYRNNNTL